MSELDCTPLICYITDEHNRMVIKIKAIFIATILSLFIIPASPANDNQNEDKPIVWIEKIIQMVRKGWGKYENLEKECVILRSKEAVNLKGWIYGYKKHITFPDVVIGGMLRVCTGEILHQNRKRAVWNQEGDTAYLYNAEGVLIYEFTYDEIVVETEFHNSNPCGHHRIETTASILYLI